MVPLPPGNVRPSAGWIAIVLGGLWSVGIADALSHSARADDLNGAMDRVRRSDQATPRRRAASRRSPSTSSLPRHGWPPTPRRGFARRSRRRLKKRDVIVKKNARLEITGEYREVEDPSDRKTVVRIPRPHRRSGQRPAGERVRGEGRQHHVDRRPGRRHDGAAADPCDRGSRAVDPRGHPEAERPRRLDADLGRSRSPFAIEILVGPAPCSDAELRPRPATVDEGQAYMNIRTDERYAIRLINDAPFDVAVDPHDRWPQPLRLQREPGLQLCDRPEAFQRPDHRLAPDERGRREIRRDRLRQERRRFAVARPVGGPGRDHGLLRRRLAGQGQPAPRRGDGRPLVAGHGPRPDHQDRLRRGRAQDGQTAGRRSASATPRRTIPKRRCEP